MKILMIIPIFRLQDERWKNFYFILSKLNNTNIDILVSEQVFDSSQSEVEKHIKSLKKNNIRYLSVYLCDAHINKSFIYNFSVSRNPQYDYYWFHDSDICTEFEKCYLKILSCSDFSIIKPFQHFLILTSAESNMVRLGKNIQIRRNCQTNNCLTAGSIILSSNVLRLVRGWNEVYSGWGYEDLDLKLRISHIPALLIDTLAVHLYHKKSSIIRENYLSNQNKYKEMLNMNTQNRILSVLNTSY